MHIKEMRTRIQMTQTALAEQLGTTQQTIARWENGKTELSVSQLKALAIALHCSVEQLVGPTTNPTKRTNSAFSVIKSGRPFGTLRLRTNSASFAFPVDEDERNRIVNCLHNAAYVPAQQGVSRWLAAGTLNNRVLFINPTHCREISLIHDDVEEMPDFEHPEVYSALENEEVDNLEPSLKKLCETFTKKNPEIDPIEWTNCLQVHFATGEMESFFMCEEVTEDLLELEDSINEVRSCQFLRVQSERGYQSIFMNLNHVAFVSAPANLYLRQISELMEE